jgi:hypothetical protein
MTLSIKGLFVTLSINGIQHNDTRIKTPSAFLLSVVILSVIMPSVIMLSVFILNVVAPTGDNLIVICAEFSTLS